MTTDRTCAGLLPLIDALENEPLLWDARDRVWITRADVRAAAVSLGDTLAAPRTQLVFLLAQNTSASVIALLAAAAAGHAIALIDPGLESAKLDHLFSTYRPDIILSTGDPESLCLPGDTANWQISRDAASRLSIGRNSASSGNPAIAPELLMLLSTSGTTGSVKFVRLSDTAITANAGQIVTALAITPESTAIAHLPLHYSYGLSVVTSHLRAGGRIAVIDDAVTSPSFWQSVGDAGGTHFPGVPFHYTVLARLGLTLVPDSVVDFTQAGGALDTRFRSTVLGRLAERNGRFYVMYGQTEASPRITTLPFQMVADKAGSVGPALPGGLLSVEDAEGRSLGAHETGHVVYRGPNVMLGYAENRADLAKGDEMHGRLETGDLGYLDDEGCLFLSGRTKRFAKISGLRLGLDEIEAEIASLGFIACLDGGEKVIVAHEGEIADLLKPRLKALALQYKIPATSFALRQMAMIPRKTSGKIDYGRLKEMSDV